MNAAIKNEAKVSKASSTVKRITLKIMLRVVNSLPAYTALLGDGTVCNSGRLILSFQDPKTRTNDARRIDIINRINKM
jgi:hypothetical protein